MHDAILILGGGVREGGDLPPWSVARFELALELERGEPLICLSAGTIHRPPPLENGFPITEALAGARYLLSRGVPSSRIRLESSSYDTIGNAYLVKLLHVDPAGWRKLLVVTSEFHMPRSRAIFDWVFGFESQKYELKYAASPDCGIDPESLAFRRQKEQQSLDAFRSVQSRIVNLQDLHTWFFTEHRAYSADGGRRLERTQDPRLLESY